MTERTNGSPSVKLGDWENRPSLGAAYMETQGHYSPEPGHPPGPRRAGGFDAGALWDGHYTLRPFVDAEGDIPHPTQARIDAFKRKGAEFAIEAERLARDAEAAQRKLDARREDARAKAEAEGKTYTEPFNATKQLKELEEAMSEERRLYDLMRDHVAEFCAGSPTREELGTLPDFKFREFVDWIGSLINPEV